MATDTTLMGLLKTPSQIRKESQDRMMEESLARSQMMLRGSTGGSTALPGLISSYGAQAAQRGAQAGAGLLRGVAGGLGQAVGGQTGQRIADLGIPAEERQARAQQQALRGVDLSSIDGLKQAYDRLTKEGANPALLEQLSARIDAKEADAFSREMELRTFLQEQQEAASAAPKTETRIEGDERVTYEWKPDQKTWKEIARGPRYKPGTQININEGAGAFDKQYGEEMSSQLAEAKGAVQNAQKSLENLSVMEGLLDQGVITGTLANFRTGVERALATAGLIDGQRVTNTETFLATGAQQTLALLQTGAAGAGTGISDADRDFMEKAAGGNITVTEEAIRRIISINRKIAQNVYGTHNQIVEDIKTTYPDSKTAERISVKYYPGQRARDADGNVIVFDPVQGWVIEE